MKVLNWFKNINTSPDKNICLDLSCDETEYYIDILDHKTCSSMNGSFCVARNLIEITSKALKKSYNKKVNCKDDLRLVYSLAARIYFLAKYALNNDDALDIINLIYFFNLPFKQQYEALQIYSELHPWLAEELNDFYNSNITVPSSIQRTLTELFGILADEHTKSLFSRQGRYIYEIDPKTGVEQRKWRTFSSCNLSNERLNVTVVGEKCLSKYVKTFVEKMDEFYKKLGTCLAIYSYTPHHPLSEHRHIDKIVREMVFRCTNPSKYIEKKPDIRMDEEVFSLDKEESLALANLNAVHFNENLSKIKPEGFRYQQIYDSTSFMVALTTPNSTIPSLRIYRHFCSRDRETQEYYKEIK